jgi:hypothetical protein
MQSIHADDVGSAHRTLRTCRWRIFTLAVRVRLRTSRMSFHLPSFHAGGQRDNLVRHAILENVEIRSA